MPVPGATAAHWRERGRRNPRFATSDFHGTSRTIATPAAACRRRTARAGCPDNSNATQPLAKASASTNSNARFVIRPVTALTASGLGLDGWRAALRHFEVVPHPTGLVATNQRCNPVAARNGRAEDDGRRASRVEAARPIRRRPSRLERSRAVAAANHGASPGHGGVVLALHGHLRFHSDVA